MPSMYLFLTMLVLLILHMHLILVRSEEIQNFRTKGKTELEEYYKALFDSTGMQKKVNTTPSGGYRPRRETIRNVTVDVLFVSQDFITNILTATKECINRCKVVRLYLLSIAVSLVLLYLYSFSIAL